MKLIKFVSISWSQDDLFLSQTILDLRSNIDSTITVSIVSRRRKILCSIRIEDILILFSAVIGGAVVGLLCAILVVMFIVYRMRKKDEGSYALDEPRRSPAVQPFPKPGAPHHNREFYAWNECAKKTSLILLKFTKPSKEHTEIVTNLRHYLTGLIKWWLLWRYAWHALIDSPDGTLEERRSERWPISRFPRTPLGCPVDVPLILS